jgi:two-component system chemotaxis response regulator CheY
MRQFLIGYLHEGGYFNITEADNGMHALELFRKIQPDVVLLDLIMPIVNGEDAMGELVKEGAKIVIISAMGQDKMMQRVLDAGAKGYLVKPYFDAEKIDKAIVNALKN